jgi:predicted ATPase/class 3 adenylate cyclase
LYGRVAALPEGTVTFLFTDIEGSTALLRERADEYPELLAEHRRLLREAADRHGGVVFGSEGDALFMAFGAADAAVAAAREGQQALTALPLRVRMGVHTGEPAIAEGDYVGLDVHRVARIAASAHGGQVVVSRPARDAADDVCTFTDLGEHRLKDLPEPEWLFQAGEGDFPPLRSLSNTNLPAPATPLVGRARELGEIAALLRGEETRLLTVTGPGGTGKTRLAVAAGDSLADAFANGVFVVPLAPLRDPELVLPEVARSLGVSEQPGEPLVRSIARRLEERHAHVVLDNVEQVLGAATEVAALLESAPGLAVIATSREPLRIRGEREYALPPLALDEALDLFMERALAVRADCAVDWDMAVAREIVERLDRLPLAIELAAARVKLLSLGAIAERLGERLTFVAGTGRDLPERHRTLRGAIEWSYDLLEPDERTLFARLAVFMGGWTLDAAETVADADLDTLASLLDKSLVTRAGGDRFTMLETIREYAVDRLDASGSAEDACRAHAEYFLGVARDAERAFDGPDAVAAVNRLEQEHDNLRSALDWALRREPGLGAALAAELGGFWYRHTHVVEGATWLQRAAGADDGSDPLRRARILHNLGVLTDLQGAPGAAALLEESIALYRETDDIGRLTRSMNSLGIVARNAGDLPLARRQLEECLAIRRELGDRKLISVTTCDLGVIAVDEGDLDAAEAYFRESLAIDRETGDQPGVAVNVGNLGWVELARGRVEEARPLVREALELFDEVGDREGLAEALEQAAVLAGRDGKPEAAARLAGSAAGLRTAVGVPHASDFDRERLERGLDPVRAALGGDFGPRYEEGRALDTDAAVTHALGEV